MQPWWQKLFDASYLKVYDYTRHSTSADVEFLEDVLDLEPGQRVLDMCCGFGRHSIALAHKDMRVTGVDFSSVLLKEARRHARVAGVNVEWVESDSRGFRSRKRFDAAINLFTAFGYFDDEVDDELQMERMAHTLKRGGRLLIDTMNRDYVVRHFLPFVVTEFDGGHAVDKNHLNSESGRLEVERHLYFKGKSKRQHFSIRLYTGRELARMAERCGLEVDALYGNFERDPLSMETHRLVLLARKP